MTSTKQDLLSPITVAFQQGLGQKFRQESGTRIDLSTFDELELVKVSDEGVYPIVIKAEASPCVSEDGSTNGGAISTNSQITQAVFEKEKGEYQNLFLHGYGAIFNFLGILVTVIIKGLESFNDLEGHSRATLILIVNNAAQGILSSFFFKYADTILKKYSSTVATIFTGFASAAFFGHTLTINFMLGISIVFILMHQFFSPLAKVKEEENGVLVLEPVQSNHRYSITSSC